jgi:hypothetical protein
MPFPNIPGLPSLAAGVAVDFLGAASDVLMTADTFSYFAGDFGAQWGVFQGGSPIIAADSTLSLEFRKDWVVGDYPIERGSFESYDKVEVPFDARVRFAAGGSPDTRQGLLNSIKAIAGDTNLYDVVTPDAVYTSANIVHYGYHRAAEAGVSLLIVDLWVKEIRVANGTTLANTAQPSGADPSETNSVQTTPATQPDYIKGVPSFAVSTSINFLQPSPFGSL